VKSVGLLGFQRIIVLILAIIRIKVSAVFLEPAGVGIVSQVSSFRGLLQQFVNLGVGAGVTKYTAEYSSKQDRESLERLLQTVASAVVVTGLIIFFTSTLFAPQLAQLVLADRSRALLFVLTGAAIPLMAQVEVINRCLQGMLKIQAMVVLAIVGSALGLVITVPLIILTGVTGAVLSITLTAFFSFVIGQVYLHRTVLREYSIRLRPAIPEKRISVNLLRFGGTRGIVAVVEILTLLTIRSVIIKQLGAESNGLYQVAFGMSNQYLGLVMGAVWMYGMPKAAAMLGNPSGIAKLQNDALRLLFLTLMPFMILLLVFRGVWIPLLFSQAFLGAYSLIGWQMIGDFFRAVTWAANLTIIARERFSFLVGLNIIFYSVQLGSFWLLLPHIGLKAAPVSYALANGIVMPLTLIGHYLYDRFVYSPRNWWLVAKSALVLALTLILTFSPNAKPVLNYLIPLGALAVWTMTAISRQEAMVAIHAGHNFLARR